MKLHLLGTAVVLLVAFLSPRYECRVIDSPGAAQRAPPLPERQLKPSVPFLERLGEEYFIRLNGNGNSNSLGSMLFPRGSPPAVYNRASQLHLTQRLLQGKTASLKALVGGLPASNRLNDSVEERGRRSEEPPISLDLTFHLLREMMEMSRNENLAQQAQSNRRMMDLFGK